MRQLSLLVCFVVCVTAVSVRAEEVEKLVFLILEKNEVIASNTRLGRFDKLDLRAKEKVLDYKAANAVAVVVTNQRYIAYGVLTGSWKALRREAGEKFSSMEVADYSASIVTTDRYLNFYGRTGTWRQTDR